MKEREFLDYIWKYCCYLWNESDELQNKAEELWDKSEKIWVDAVSKIYGDIGMEWKNLSKEKESYECHLKNGEVFKP